MKTLQSTHKCFAMIGIQWPHQLNQKCLCNVKTSFGLFLFAFLFVCDYKFLICEAKTWTEYAELFYNISTLVAYTFDYAVHIWKSEELFQFTEKFVSVIEKSKSSLRKQSYHLFDNHINCLIELNVNPFFRM